MMLMPIHLFICHEHQYETVSGFVCEVFGCILRAGENIKVVLERDNQDDDDDKHDEDGSDHQDVKERHQIYRLERQSLGSPMSKLRGHGGDDALIAEDPKRSRSVVDDDDERKATKPRRLSFNPSSSAPPPLSSRPEKFIHLIPVLTLFCFLILYLSSHNPSQSDSSKISNIRGFFELRISDALAIRSMINLQELEKHTPKSRSHRKFAHF